MQKLSGFLKLMIVSIAPSIALVLVKPEIFSLVRFFPDDAFYYLQTAWNFSRTGFVSFDGTNTITGFHPLWLVVSSGFMLLLGKHSALIVIFLFNSLVVATSLYLLSKIFLLFYKKPLGLGLLSILTLPVFNFFLFTSSGMESGLLIISFSWFLYMFCRSLQAESLSHGDAFLVGLAAGLVALSRLDSIVVLLFFGLYYVIWTFKIKKFGFSVTALFAFLIVISPYFMWLWNTQENFLPMSSLAKYGRERWPIKTVFGSLAGTNILGQVFFIVPVLLNLLALTIPSSDSENKVLVSIVKTSALSGVAYLAYVLFVAHEPYRWYLNITQIISLFSLIWLASRTGYEKLLKARFVVPTVLVFNFGFLSLWSNIETTSYGLLKMTLEVNDLVPADSVIATNDSGVMGYFSSSSIHNLDGIANSLQNWDQFLSSLDYSGYFKKYGVDYMIIRAEFLTKDGIKDVFIYPDNNVASCKEFYVVRFGKQVMCRVSN